MSKPIVRSLAKDGDADAYEMRIPGNPLLRYRFYITNCERMLSNNPRHLLERYFRKAYFALTNSEQA